MGTRQHQALLDYLADERERQGVSYQKLADASKVDVAVVHAMLTGKTTSARFINIIAVAEALGLRFVLRDAQGRTVSKG